MRSKRNQEARCRQPVAGPFTIVYFTEVRHVSLDTAGVLMGLIAVAALVVTGPSGALTAVVGVIAFMAIFGFGETMRQSTIPALVNDLADDHTRGRANGLNSGAFQLGAITGPVMAGLVLHRGHWVSFIVILIVGCGVVALSAVGIESIVPRRVNGIPDPAQDEVEIPHVPVHD